MRGWLASDHGCRWAAGGAGLAVALGVLAAATAVQSAEYSGIDTRRTLLGERPVATETEAARWGLDDAEWGRFETLMHGRRGRWSREADPLLVLGAHAASPEERRRYAERYVRAERARVEGELAFERAVGEAWARLYGDEALFAGAAASAATGGLGSRNPIQRFAVAVAADCVRCRDMVREFWSGTRPVDFHVLGTGGDDASLRAWVALLGVDQRRAGVTVNHGDAFEGQATPAVLGQRLDGTWVRVGG